MTDALLIEAAEACCAAYTSPPRVPAGWKPSKDAGVAPDGLLVATDGKRELICFRGTHNLQEWIFDGEYHQEKFAGELVHAGFLRDYSRFRDFLLSRRYKGRMLICGHSLGGALATFAALELAPFEPTVITFGSPRVGSPGFVGAYSAKAPNTHRVYNVHDVVPMLPPETIADPFRFPELLDHFEHVGEGIPLKFRGERGGIFGPNHAIANYRDALKLRRKAA